MITKQNKKDFSIYIHNAVMKSKINLDKTFVFTDVKGDIDKFADDVVGHLGHFIEEGPESISLVQVNGNKIDLFGVTNGTLKKEFQKEVDKLGGINAEDYVDMNTNEKHSEDIKDDWDDIVKEYGFDDMKSKALIAFKNSHIDKIKDTKNETDLWSILDSLDLIDEFVSFYHLEKHFVKESVYDNLKTVKELASQRLADFFRVDVKDLTAFNFDGTDDIKKLTAALNSTSDSGTELYYKAAIKLSKADLNESENENDTEETAYRWWRDKLSINQMKQLGKKYLTEYEYSCLLGSTSQYVKLKKTKELINKIFTQVLVDSPDLIKEAKNIKELSKVITKRRIMNFETFKSKRKDIENDSKEEKGEHEVVKASKTGSIDGKKGYAVIAERKNNLQAKALVIDNALKIAKFTSADEHVSDYDYDIDYNTANIVAVTSDIAKDIAKEIKRIGYNVEVTDNTIEVLDEVSESKSTGIPNLTISKMTFEDAYKDNPNDGIVLLGCGGDINEWIIGVSNNLKEEGISKTDKPDELWNDVRILTTSGGRTDVMLTPKKGAPIDIGKMAMWRIRFGDCSWISDYKDNYKEQHKA